VSTGASSSRTAILFFSHRPEREWGNKQFVRRDVATSREVARALYRHSRAAVQASGLPVVEVPGERQRGGDFGTRLANAFADAFAQGYDRVIAVGSDCPRLHEVDWRDVAGRLDRETPVLGPTPEREGAYLIGLTRSQFEAAALADLPWQSPALFDALARHLTDRAGTAPSLLTARDDVNSHRELVALLRRPTSLPGDLLAALRAVLGTAVSAAGSDRPPRRHHVTGRRSRAPPLSVSAG
jgi:hypothetical protein